MGIAWKYRNKNVVFTLNKIEESSSSFLERHKGEKDYLKGKKVDGEVERWEIFLLFLKFIISILAYFKTIMLYN